MTLYNHIYNPRKFQLEGINSLTFSVDASVILIIIRRTADGISLVTSVIEGGEAAVEDQR